MATPNVGDAGGVSNASLWNINPKKVKQQEEQAGSFGPGGENFLQVVTQQFKNVQTAVPGTETGHNTSVI